MRFFRRASTGNAATATTTTTPATTDPAPDVDAGIVKALRQKCNDLEDRLDAAVDGKADALASKAKLEEDLASLRQELSTERKASWLAEVLAGRGQEVVERLQTALEEQQARRQGLQSAYDLKEQRVEHLKEQLQSGRASLADLQQQLSEAKEQLRARRDDAASKSAEHAEGQRCAEQAQEDAAKRLTECKKRLQESRQQCSELQEQANSALERIQELEEERGSFEKRLATLQLMDRELQVKEIARQEAADAAAGALQQELDQEHEQQAQLQRKADDGEATRNTLELERQDLQADLEGARGELASVEQQLQVATATDSELQQSLTRTEAELERCRRTVVALREDHSDAATLRDAALEQSEEREEQRRSSEAELLRAEEGARLSLARLESKAEDEARPLHSALSEARERRAKLQPEHDELQRTHALLQEQLQGAEGDFATLEQALESADRDSRAAEASAEELQGQAARAESVLEEQRRLLTEAHGSCAELLPERDVALQRLEDAGHARRREEARVKELAQQLEEQLRVRMGHVESYHELRRQHSDFLRAWEAERRQAAEDIAAGPELAAEGCEEFQRRLDALAEDCSLLRDQANALAAELGEERRLHTEDGAVYEDCRVARDALGPALSRARATSVGLVDELVAERRRHMQSADAGQAMKQQHARLAALHETLVDEDAVAQAELERSAEAHGEERRRRAELQEQLDAVQSEHEDLFARYAAAVEQVDILKAEGRKVVRERDFARAALEESRRLEEEERARKEEVEIAKPPPPLTVSDVLISVAFDGVAAPLELRPWDTDFEGVIDSWLTREQRAKELQPSLVRYLRQLEETAEAFPVRVEAKLLDVHEQFAM